MEIKQQHPLYDTDSEILELRRLGYKAFEGVRFWLLAGLMLLPVMLIFIIVVFPFENESLKKLSDTFTKKGEMHTIINFIVFPLAILAVRMTMRAKMILDTTGIRFLSGVPAQLQFIRLDWQYRWQDISSITFRKEKFVNPLMSSVLLKIQKKTVRIVPWQWIDPENSHYTALKKRKFFESQADVLKKVEETPVIKFIKKHNLFTPTDNAPDPVDTLNSNRKAQLVVVLFALFILYFITDVYFGLTEYYAPATPWHIFILTGCLGGFGTYYILDREKLRKKDSAAMAAIFGLGIGLISYPVSIRTNIWFDDQGLVPYTYELNAENKWIPGDPKAPDLEFDKWSEYWQQFKPGDIKTFELRHVGMGYTQINMQPVYEEQKAFYRK